MNNKEKATEIVSQIIGVSSDYYEICYDATLEMAQWKDEQFSKFLLWLNHFYVIKESDDGESMTYEKLIDVFKIYG